MRVGVEVQLLVEEENTLMDGLFCWIHCLDKLSLVFRDLAACCCVELVCIDVLVRKEEEDDV